MMQLLSYKQFFDEAMLMLRHRPMPRFDLSTRSGQRRKLASTKTEFMHSRLGSGVSCGDSEKVENDNFQKFEKYLPLQDINTNNQKCSTVSPAETRLTVYRRRQVRELSDVLLLY